jgi:hypothetical protein
MRELLLLSIHVIASSAAEPLRSGRSQSAGFRPPREGESALALFLLNLRRGLKEAWSKSTSRWTRTG